jgi:hypothetical protein
MELVDIKVGGIIVTFSVKEEKVHDGHAQCNAA